MSARLAGLLRAINVGGRKLAMADLRRVAAQIGLTDPETLLASGNVIFGTTLAASAAGQALSTAIHADLGLRTEVLVRSGLEIAAVVAANPFPEEARAEPARLMAMFIDAAVEAPLATLTSACRGGEQVRAGPGCLYLWFPKGAGASALSNAVIERRIGVRGTARNWNTVSKIAQRLALSSTTAQSRDCP